MAYTSPVNVGERAKRYKNIKYTRNKTVIEYDGIFIQDMLKAICEGGLTESRRIRGHFMFRFARVLCIDRYVGFLRH